MTDKEKFITLVICEPLKKADAIILLEGDKYFRLKKVVELYKGKLAKTVVVSGGIFCPAQGSYPDLTPRLIKMGIPSKAIIIESAAQNTRDQAKNIMALAKKNKWRKIILVASHYHQFRAFLTFLQAMKEEKIKIQIINAPAADLSWFSENKWGRRIDLLVSEFAKLELYNKKHHIASFSEAIKHQAWKEKQKN